MTQIWNSWFACLRRRFPAPAMAARRPSLRARLEVEGLEDRTAPAAFTVVTVMDNGDNANPTAGSLRAGIKAVNSGANDSINFDIANAPQQLPVKKNPLPAIIKPTIIDGTPPPGKPNQTIEVLRDASLTGLVPGLTLGQGTTSSATAARSTA
jgi:hypothetical protein